MGFAPLNPSYVEGERRRTHGRGRLKVSARFSVHLRNWTTAFPYRPVISGGSLR
jgi:hypothetical protein